MLKYFQKRLKVIITQIVYHEKSLRALSTSGILTVTTGSSTNSPAHDENDFQELVSFSAAWII